MLILLMIFGLCCPKCGSKDVCEILMYRECDKCEYDWIDSSVIQNTISGYKIKVEADTTVSINPITKKTGKYKVITGGIDDLCGHIIEEYYITDNPNDNGVPLLDTTGYKQDTIIIPNMFLLFNDEKWYIPLQKEKK